MLSIVVGLSQPVVRYPGQDLSVVYALDASRSVSPEFLDKSLTWVDEFEQKYSPSASKIIVFGENRAVVNTTEEVRNLSVSDSSEHSQSSEHVEQSATNIEAAVDEALALLDPGTIKRVVLFSDGNQTEGSLLDTVSSSRKVDARIYPMVADASQVQDFWIDNVELPQRCRAGEPVIASVSVHSPDETKATLAISANGETIGGLEAELRGGVNEVSVPIKFSVDGAVDVLVQLDAPGDTYKDNNVSRINMWVEPEARVLYVEGMKGTSQFLKDALTSDGFNVDVKGAMPTDDWAERYDAVILSDVLAGSLPPALMSEIQSYVRDSGGGLIFAGGENTFGEEGYSDTTLESVLPAEFKIQEKRKDIAIVIAIDRSYSMKGRKIEYAKEAARASLDLLEEQHYFGVVAFDSQPYVPVPVEPVKSKRKAEALISRIQASGQTNIYPALGIVYRLLRDLDAPTKHVILLSDGDTAPAEFERLVERMKEKNIVISTVTIGEGGNPGLMRQIADWGNGRNYMAVSAESIPQIFTEETKKVVSTSLVEQDILSVVKQPIEAMEGIDLSVAPPLKGHVAVKARDTAEVILATQEGAPLLTRWQYGLGKTLLFTSDVKNRWSSDWIEWEGYGQFWSQLTRGVVKQLGSDTVFFSAAKDGKLAVFDLTLLTEDGEFVNGLQPTLEINRGESPKILPMTQISPGHYQLRTPFVSQNPVSGVLTEGGGVTPKMARAAGSRSVFPGFPDEYRFIGPNIELLNAVAESTGGRVGASSSEIADPGEDLAYKRLYLWPFLLFTAAFLYLCELFLRRSPVIWRRFSGQ